MKQWTLIAGLSLLATAGLADTVRLSDGSSLSGKVVEQANGDVVVTTGAGEITVPKGKVSAIVSDSKASVASEGDMSYVNEVERRRKKYGNNDGIPRTANLQKQQISANVGLMNYTGDAFLIKDPLTGANLLNASDLGGVSYGLTYAGSFTDYVALEIWANYAAAFKTYSVGINKYDFNLQRFDLAIGPKIQKAIALGEPEQSLTLIPNIGVTPLWSNVSGKKSGQSFDSSSLGASLNGGVDFQFGGALVSAKLRYLLCSDVTGNLQSNNTSAWMPQIGVGFAF